MKTLLFRSLSIGLILTLSACSTSSLRSPTSTESEVIYQYSDHFSCVSQKGPSDNEERTKLSALSGFKVGPESFSRWQSSNKKVLRPFTSDGCSVSPDGIPGSEHNRKWTQCCVEHDVAYWLGGTTSEKEVADNKLQQCIAQKGHPGIGELYKRFTKEFGGPNSSQTFRWGYGWNYKRPYSPLSVKEESMVLEEYGYSSGQVKQNLAARFASLTKVCDTYDYGLQSLSSDEEEIYQILSKSIKKSDVIEWAKHSYFNLEKREYLVKLQSCVTPVTFIFFKNREKDPEVISACHNP